MLGEKVTRTVITGPACFHDLQRVAIKNAAFAAGLDVLQILNEPTAAAIAYGLDKDGVKDILIFDLGSGKLEISIYRVKDRAIINISNIW